jgi:DNA-binding HxlR family transcriptional regulator
VSRRSEPRERILIHVNFAPYPIQSSLGVLGRKWGFLVLMNIALSRAQRFNEMLRSNPGMSKRILALRLRELENQGFIRRAEQRRAYTKWELTQKGADVLPVLLTLIHFGSKWREDPGSPVTPSSTLSSSFDVSYSPSVLRRTRAPRPTPSRATRPLVR